MKIFLVFTVVILTLVGRSLAVRCSSNPFSGKNCRCPDEDVQLQRWSEPNTWDSGQKPAALQEVRITKAILLDESPPELTSIIVEDGGKLVFSPDSGELLLKLRYILVHGELHIGSEDCPFTGKVRIILTGRRNEDGGRYNVTGFGEKFIGVEKNGVLHIHGEKKLSWTKLAKTVEPLYNKLDKKFKPVRSEQWRIGLAMCVLNVSSGNHDVTSYGGYTLMGRTFASMQRVKRQMISALQGVKSGEVVMIAVQRRFSAENYTDLMDVIEETAFGSVTGTLRLRDVRHEAYAVVFQKDNSSFFAESPKPVTERGEQSARASVYFRDIRLKVSAISRLALDNDKKFFVDFKAMKTPYGYPVIDLTDNATSWKPGDQLVFTSTDTDMEHAEIATVVRCTKKKCSDTQIRVDAEFDYRHFGSIIDNVDMRGEVALLSRNIVIEGEMEPSCPTSNKNCWKFNFDTYGGHLKVNRNFGSVAVEGVELYHMGKMTNIGHYPLHFHMCNDTTYKTAYFRDNSIHHSFFRCVTIHATHGVTVRGNACFDTFGHAYYLEDGGEKHTVFDGNLGASIRRGDHIKTGKRRPAVFWITNPLTTLTNNVAAGSQGIGIWYIFPKSPLGPSSGLGFMAEDEARHTAITKFDNNVVHSCQDTGLYFDEILLDEEGSIKGSNQYNPRENPLDPLSNPKDVILTKLTAYNNKENAWIRGGFFKLKQFSLSDANVGLTLLRGGPNRFILEESVIVGESENKDHNAIGRIRVVGFLHYDGMSHINGVWFNGFQNTTLKYTAGALGFRPIGPVPKSLNLVENLEFGFDDFAGGNRVYYRKRGQKGFMNMNANYFHAFEDKDGSVTGQAKSTVVIPKEFYVTSNCTYRHNWQMAICPHTYSRIIDIGNRRPVDVYRSDKPDCPERFSSERSFLALLSNTIYYTLQFVEAVPVKFSFTAQRVSSSQSVVVGACIPKDSKFDISSQYPVERPDLSHWTAVNSIEQLYTTEGSYFHDSQKSALYVRLSDNIERLQDYDMCDRQRQGCPSVEITVRSRNRTDVKCNNVLWTPYGTKNSSYEAVLPTNTRTFPRADRPQGWGAGSTRPFAPVDGGLSEWSQWDGCTGTSPLGSIRRRHKLCNNPEPQYGGKDCDGNRVEIQLCTI